MFARSLSVMGPLPTIANVSAPLGNNSRHSSLPSPYHSVHENA